jgi:hypothetical protein
MHRNANFYGASRAVYFETGLTLLLPCKYPPGLILLGYTSVHGAIQRGKSLKMLNVATGIFLDSATQGWHKLNPKPMGMDYQINKLYPAHRHDTVLHHCRTFFSMHVLKINGLSAPIIPEV